MRTFLYSLAASLTLSAVASAHKPDPSALVFLRVEGADKTIFEGPIKTRGNNITTLSGGTHNCNGLNNGANHLPGPTCTSALDDASRERKFTYDGTFESAFDDYFITRIGTSAQTATQFWGLLLDYEFTPVGGCQQEVKTGQEILWAFDAFSKQYFLKATGPAASRRNYPAIYRVVDGSTGHPVAGATIGGRATDQDGKAAIVFTTTGVHFLKAEHPDGIRSNRITVLVLP